MKSTALGGFDGSTGSEGRPVERTPSRCWLPVESSRSGVVPAVAAGEEAFDDALDPRYALG